VILTGEEHSDTIHHSAEYNLHTVSEGIYPLLSVVTDLLDGLLSRRVSFAIDWIKTSLPDVQKLC